MASPEITTTFFAVPVTAVVRAAKVVTEYRGSYTDHVGSCVAQNVPVVTGPPEPPVVLLSRVILQGECTGVGLALRLW